MATLPGLIAKRFIARPEVYALQSPKTGAWRPSYSWNPADQKYDGPVRPFTKEVLEDHIAGKHTVGHYMVNTEGNCKLFAFDLDLIDGEAPWIQYPSARDMESLEDKFGDDLERKNAAWEHLIKLGRHSGNPRELWQHKTHPSRQYYLRQMRGLAEELSQRIFKELEIPVAVDYSGFKGVHVYGWHGMLPAADSRTLALEILDSFGRFEAFRGESEFRDTVEEPDTGYPTLSIEVYPKQEKIREGGFGNLMALPLGVNYKAPKSRKFFVDQRSPHATIVPRKDPIPLLEHGNPWED